MEQGKKIELSEAEKEQIRERLSRYLAQAAYDCEDPADNGTVRTSIEPEDNYTIYKAVQSGDESLKRLACEVIYRTNKKYFRKQAAKYLQNEQDIEEAVQELLGVDLYKDIEMYDPDRAGITHFLELRAMTSFQRKYGETIGLTSKYYIDSAVRVKNAKQEIYGLTMDESPSEYDILEHDRKTHEKLIAPSRYEPHNVYAQQESDKRLKTALGKIEQRYRRIIIKALELSTLAPVEANKQLIRFVRTAILKDPKATDERARTYIEAAYNEFGRAMSATTSSRSREQGSRRKLSFARSLSQDVYEREVQDIMDALEEDISLLD